MNKKTIYLTINDAPSRNFQEKIEFLITKNIPALIFCRGDFIEKRPQELVYAVKKGFTLGNHSYSHRHFSFLDFSEIKQEIIITDQLINEIYTKAGVKRTTKLFRFPYGDRGEHLTFTTKLGWELDHLGLQNELKKRRIQKLLYKLGYTSFKLGSLPSYEHQRIDHQDIFWTHDFEEYLNPPLKKVIEKFEKKLEHSNEEIILLHDYEKTTAYFYNILENLSEHSLQFKQIS